MVKVQIYVPIMRSTITIFDKITGMTVYKHAQFDLLNVLIDNHQCTVKRAYKGELFLKKISKLISDY